MWGYIFAHTFIGLFKALEKGASVLIDENNLPGKQNEIYFPMSNMWKLKNQLLLHLNICCPIKNVHCWIFWQLSPDVPWSAQNSFILFKLAKASLCMWTAV